LNGGLSCFVLLLNQFSDVLFKKRFWTEENAFAFKEKVGAKRVLRFFVSKIQNSIFSQKKKVFWPGF
jgi:hypothetical protein